VETLKSVLQHLSRSMSPSLSLDMLQALPLLKERRWAMPAQLFLDHLELRKQRKRRLKLLELQ
jgi:hypothetical protein